MWVASGTDANAPRRTGAVRGDFNRRRGEEPEPPPQVGTLPQHLPTFEGSFLLSCATVVERLERFRGVPSQSPRPSPCYRLLAVWLKLRAQLGTGRGGRGSANFASVLWVLCCKVGLNQIRSVPRGTTVPKPRRVR